MRTLQERGKELIGNYTKEIIGKGKLQVKAPPPVEESMRRIGKR